MESASTMTSSQLEAARLGAISAAFDDYQRWSVTTAKYPTALALPYLALGLGDEAGELLEKTVNMALLSNATRAQYVRRELLPELGDIGWYLAQLLLALDVRFSEAFTLSLNVQPGFDATLDSAVTHAVIRATQMQGRVKKSIRDGVDVRAKVLEHAAHLVRAMDFLARANGTNLLLVLGENRRKLEDRLQRGAIKGEGDHR